MYIYQFYVYSINTHEVYFSFIMKHSLLGNVRFYFINFCLSEYLQKPTNLQSMRDSPLLDAALS